MRDAREKGKGGPTVVILTASDVEFDAVERLLTGGRKGEARDDSGTRYRLGWVNGTPWRVALAEIGRGDMDAAVVVTHAVSLFRPRLVMLVGTAERLKESVATGDVVVAAKVYAIHSGILTDSGFHARPETWRLPHEVEQTAFAARRAWRRQLDAPAVYFTPVAAGETALGGEGTALHARVRLHYEDAVAYVRGSAGVARAMQMHRECSVTVRGIGDGSGSGEETAARNAAAFAVAVIRELEDGSERTAMPQVVERPVEVPRGWRAGASVRFAKAEFLLEEGQLGEKDGEFWGRALRVGARARHVWLRRADGPGEGREALRRENEFLTNPPCPGFVRPEAYEARGDTTLLALRWLSTGPGKGRPILTLAEARGTTPLLSIAYHRALEGCARLADTLAALHEAGLAHRALSPESVLVPQAGYLRLRDLGAAFRHPTPGEGPPTHRAPEQEYPTYRPVLIGPPTDVYQLASLTYWLLTA
ncbi:MAG TPA: hypothetical protein VIU15_01220, partial [Streptomyces sp.]